MIGADPKQSNLAGIALMIASVTVFALVNAYTKMVVTSYSPGQILLIRGFGALALLLPFFVRVDFAALRKLPRKDLHLLRVVLSVADVTLFITATKYIPLADATTCYLAAPIFVTALSALVLGEPVGWRRWIAVAVGFVGVMIALRPSGATVSWPALLALLGSVMAAIQMLVTRHLRGAPDIVLATNQVAGSFVLGAVVSPFVWVPPDWSLVALLVISGVVNVTGLLLLNRALKVAPASVIAPYQYTIIIWAVLLGYLVFGDVPSAETILGATIIASAGLYIFLRERAGLKRAPQPNAQAV